MLKDLKTSAEKKSFILEQIADYQKLNKDETIVLKTLSFGHTDELDQYKYLRNGKDQVTISAYAETQLLGRLRIPAAYLHRCPPDLMAANINYWISKFGDKEIQLRWHDNTVRAIFSTRYSSEMDDHLLYPIVFEGLESSVTDVETELFLKDFDKSDDISILRAVFLKAKVVCEERIYYAGISIVNSEVGRSSLWIVPTIRGGWKTDAHTFSDRMDGRTSMRHVGEMSPQKIRDAIIEAKRVAEIGIYQLLEADKDMVNKPAEEVRAFFAETDILTENILNIIDEEYKEVQEASRLKIAHSMLTAIKTLPLFQRYLAEQEVGRFLDLFSDSDIRFEAIGNDLKNAEVAA